MTSIFQRPSKIDLKKCVKQNLNVRDTFVRTHMRNIARILNGGFHRNGRSNSDDSSSDSDDDDDDGMRSFYRPDGEGRCGVQ